MFGLVKYVVILISSVQALCSGVMRAQMLQNGVDHVETQEIVAPFSEEVFKEMSSEIDILKDSIFELTIGKTVNVGGMLVSRNHDEQRMLSAIDGLKKKWKI